MSEEKHLLGNSPINSFDEDLFNFKHYANKVKKIIQLNSSNSEPLTIGIYGKWGEGKTSFLNLLKNKIEHFDKDEKGKEYLIYDFNPWRYSNEEEMLFDFFDGIAKKFYVNKETSIQEVGKLISKYSKYLKAIKISATVGIPKMFNKKVEFDVNEVFKALGEDLTGEKISLDFFKDKINERIKKVNFKVVVFVDDLDRLDKNEIYTILKLIKLNANFDNFIFITTLDSEQVAKAIKDRYGDELIDGYLFLEKIINIPIHLPKIEEEDLQYFFETKFNQIIKHLDSKDFEKKESELKEIVQNFSVSKFDSPREIIRVLNGFFIGAFGFEDEINLTDLFWIEWIKVKNEELYSKIKNYNSFGSESLFNGQNVIINFNDNVDFNLQNNNSFTVGEKISGTRKELVEMFPKFKEILDLLFPNKKMEELDINAFDENLNVNSVYHFNKYFSFHTERKVKNTNILKIKSFIKEKNEAKLKIEFGELIQNLSFHSFYTFEKLIKYYKYPNTDIEARNFFYQFLINNISQIPNSGQDMFGIDNKTRIIELIAVLLNVDETNNEQISLSIAEKLDIEQLCYFTRKFDKEKSGFRDKLEQIISYKAKEKFNNQIPVYSIPSNPVKMIMYYWKEIDNVSFEKHIRESLTDIHRIKKLIRNFPGFWNNKYYGALTKENYDYMKILIDVDFVFKKIEEYDNDLISRVSLNQNFQIDEVQKCTEEENLEQFVYWYLYEKNQNDKIDKILS